MKVTSSELLMRNFNEIFIELDPLKRAALFAESSPKIAFGFIPAVALWAARVSMKRLQRFANTSQSTATRSRVKIQIMHNVATCRWGSGMPGQPFHYTGTDFLEERDGRVSRLYTFIEQKLLQS